MTKADFIYKRCINKFIKNLFMLFKSGNHSDIKICIINHKYNIY